MALNCFYNTWMFSEVKEQQSNRQFSEGRFPTACKHEINLCFKGKKKKLAPDQTFTGLFRNVLPLFYHYSRQVCLMWLLCGLNHLLIIVLRKGGFENDTRKTKYLHLFLWDFVLQELENQNDLHATEFLVLTLCKGFIFFAAW